MFEVAGVLVRKFWSLANNLNTRFGACLALIMENEETFGHCTERIARIVVIETAVGRPLSEPTI